MASSLLGPSGTTRLFYCSASNGNIAMGTLPNMTGHVKAATEDSKLKRPRIFGIGRTSIRLSERMTLVFVSTVETKAD
jgi:hypothetical protein